MVMPGFEIAPKEVAPNIYTYDIPLPDNPLKRIHGYLIKGAPGERSLMIDTGFECDICEKTILLNLAALDVDLKQTDIFLTHTHGDHCGLAARLKRETNTIWASEIDRKLMDGFLENIWVVPNVFHGLPPDFTMRGEENVIPGKGVVGIGQPLPIDVLPIGSKLNYGGYELEMIHLPGHTPGQAGLWNAENGFFFSGDHILEHVSSHIEAWDLENDYVQLYMDSLRKVREMPVKRIFYAHGKEIPDINGRIDELLAHHEKRLDDMLEQVKKCDGPASLEYIAGGVEWSHGKTYEVLAFQQRWFAHSETLAHMLHLEREGKVRSFHNEEGAWRFELV